MNKLLLFFAIIVLFACKKDKIQPEPVVIDGRFLTNIEEAYNYTNESSYIDYNLVLELDIQNDSIAFFNYKFPLTSFDMYTGNGSHTINLPGNAHITLTLSNGANNIQFEEVYPSYLSGPSSSTVISGERTTLSTTTQAINTFSGLSGIYNLYTQAFDNTISVDTSITGSFTVSYNASPSKLVVDGVERDMPLYHSFYNKTSNYNGSFNESILHNVNWENDSLYYHYRRTGGLSWPPSDTIHYHYQGTKQ